MKRQAVQNDSIADNLEREEAIAALNKRRTGEKLSNKDISAIRKFERKRENENQLKVLTAIPQKMLVELLGTSRKILCEWEAEGLPRNPDRNYNLFAVLAWLKDRWIRKSKEQSDRESPALERYRLAKAQQAELELDRLKGNLLDAEEVNRGRVERIMAVKSAMFRVPGQTAPLLASMTDPREIQSYLYDIMCDICNTFAGVKDKINRSV